MDDEDYEPEEPETIDDDGYDDAPETSSYFNSSFERPDLQNAHRLRSTPFKEEAKQCIATGNLYPRTKRALNVFINQYLSEMSLLSNYRDENIALLDFDIAMIRMVPNYYPSDRKNPLLSHIEEQLRSHVKSIFTRSTGQDRERLLNMKQTVETRNVKSMDDVGRIKVNAPKRKSLLDGVI
ncbi:hypothetical protein GQ473_00450 [archaeon]|nr:hypothetical protein [archaeon]